MNMPGSTASGINLRQPLFDSEGHRHSVAFWSPAQLLTSSRGFLFLWDMSEGRCLMQDMSHLTLSNVPPSDASPAAVVPVAEQLRVTWKESTQVIDRLRQGSCGLRADAASPRGAGGTEPA